MGLDVLINFMFRRLIAHHSLITDGWLRYFIIRPTPAAGAEAAVTPAAIPGDGWAHVKKSVDAKQNVQLLQQILVWSQRPAGESHYSLFIVHATTKSSPVSSSSI